MAARIDKRRLVFALLAGACLAAPLPFLWSMLPQDAPHGTTLFVHMPVADDPIINVNVRDGSLNRLRVHVSDSSKRLPIAEEDLGRIPVNQVSRPSNPDADAMKVYKRHVGF
ncbi:MAG TPA: hypothetical protein V6D47_19725 [Oscillatoriaceae cyanobacterium]